MFRIFTYHSHRRYVKKETDEVTEHQLIIDLYDLEILCVSAKHASTIMEYMEEHFGVDNYEDNFYGMTEVIPSTDRTLTIAMYFVEEKIQPGLIAHEVYHAIEENAGPLYGLQSEGKAYLIDYITEHISFFYKKQLQKWLQSCQI